MRTQHFNIFNTGTESFFTPGTQLANIAAVKPGEVRKKATSSGE